MDILEKNGMAGQAMEGDALLASTAEADVKGIAGYYPAPTWGHPSHVPTLDEGVETVLLLMEEVRFLVEECLGGGDLVVEGEGHPVDLSFLWWNERYMPLGLKGGYRIPDYFGEYWDSWKQGESLLEELGPGGLLDMLGGSDDSDNGNGEAGAVNGMGCCV